MGSDEIVREIEVLPARFGASVEPVLELLELLGTGLTHYPQYPSGHVLGSDLHLTGDVVLDERPQIIVASRLIGQYHVVSDA